MRHVFSKFSGSGLIKSLIVRRSYAEGNKHAATLQVGNLTIRAAVGYSGISYLKREGDGATPAGNFHLRQGYYRADKNNRPLSQLKLAPLAKSDSWCDDPSSALYNRQLAAGRPERHETLWRDDDIYNILLMTSHNTTPRIRGAGSAIFFHLARNDYSATQGCVAISAADMRRLLPRLSRDAVIEIRR